MADTKAIFQNRLKKNEWFVSDVLLSDARAIVEKYHYAKSASNTRTYLHGLFHEGEWGEIKGVAWWIPPTKSAALNTYPENWQGVLCLSRLVVLPDVPLNACTFLLSRSRRMIDRGRWPCLVTYADEWRNHTGTIYKADNWQYVGLTKPERTYVINGRLISRKAGPKTRTKEQMFQLGAECIGSFSKHKFVRIFV